MHYDGTSWSIFQENVGSGGWLQALDMVSSTDGWAVDDHGYVYHYNGTGWSSIGRPTSKGLYGLDMVVANDGWAVGDDGVILHYNGSSWSSVSGGSSVDFTDIAMVSAEDGWAIGSEGDFFSTTSVIMHYDGQSWSRVTNPMPSRFFHAIHMQSPTNGWIGGSSGTVLHYDGSSWSPDPKLTRPATILRAVDILSRTDVWAVGGAELPFSNGENIIYFDGIFWTDFSVSNVSLNGIDMVSPTDGWAVGSTILHYNGSGWNDVGNPTSKTLYGISMLSSVDGWAVGNEGTILHYDGNTWTTVSSPTTADFYAIEMLSKSAGWILGRVGNATVFLHYEGAAWTIEQLIQDVALSSFDMLTEISGWAVGDDGKIFQYDSGTWAEAFSPTSADLDVVCFTPSGDGWAMGYKKVLHWNGSFWDDANAEKPTDKGYIVDIAFTQFGEEDIGWAVGRDLWYFKNSLLTVVEQPNKKPQSPTNFYMYQNYPNPFNPTTTISYSIPALNHVRLQIFDINGKLVKVLVDKQQLQGTYFMKWDGANSSGQPVSSGYYLYQIITGKHIETKKMLLVK